MYTKPTKRSRKSSRPSPSSGYTGHQYNVFRLTEGGLDLMSTSTCPMSDAHLFGTAQFGHGSYPTNSGTIRNVARHPRPCGECSAKKTKCVPVPSSDPALCERCQKYGLSECPPHVPWAVRRRNTVTRSDDGGSQLSSSPPEQAQESEGSSMPLSSPPQPSDYALGHYYYDYTAPANGGVPEYASASGSGVTFGPSMPEYALLAGDGSEVSYPYSTYVPGFDVSPSLSEMQSFYPVNPFPEAPNQMPYYEPGGVPGTSTNTTPQSFGYQ